MEKEYIRYGLALIPPKPDNLEVVNNAFDGDKEN